MTLRSPPAPPRCRCWLVLASDPEPPASSRQSEPDSASRPQSDRVPAEPPELRFLVVRGSWLPFSQTLPNATPVIRTRFLSHSFNLLGRILHHIVASRTLHSILVWIVVNHGMLPAKVVERRGRGYRPLQRSSLPGILRRWLSLESAVNQVVQENELGSTGAESSDGDELVHRE